MTVETVNIQTNNVAQPSLEDQARAAGIDVAQVDATALTQTAEPNARPDWLPAKFKSAEDMARSYAALEAKLGGKEAPPTAADESALPSDQGKTDAVHEQDESTTEVKPEDATPDQVKDAVENAGLDLGTLQAHYDENGSLSDDHFSALEKAGIPKTYVEEFIQLKEAQRETERQAVFAIGGGEDQFRQMMTWGADNLSAAEIDVFNKDINSADKARRESAARNLVARYGEAVGVEPQRTIGQTVRTQVGSSYESMEELQADMSDKRYNKDPAYTKRVEQKLARSPNLF